jgi:hypothetical protein
MLKDMHRKIIKISTRRDTSDLQLLVCESSTEGVPRFLDDTVMGKRKDERKGRVIDETT